MVSLSWRLLGILQYFFGIDLGGLYFQDPGLTPNGDFRGTILCVCVSVRAGPRGTGDCPPHRVRTWCFAWHILPDSRSSSAILPGRASRRALVRHASKLPSATHRPAHVPLSRSAIPGARRGSQLMICRLVTKAFSLIGLNCAAVVSCYETPDLFVDCYCEGNGAGARPPAGGGR